MLRQQLVNFIQHRDPRYRAYQTARKAAKHKSAPAKPAPTPGVIPPLAEFEEQDWQRLRHSSDEEDEEEQEEQILECVACNKSFASEASWANHERSKKHKQAVFLLRQELEIEEEEMGEHDGSMDEQNGSVEGDEEELNEAMESLAVEESLRVSGVADGAQPADLLAARRGDHADPSSGTPVDEEQVEEAGESAPVDSSPKAKQKTRRGPADLVSEVDSASRDPSRSSSRAGSNEVSKRDKRRAREAKKKAEEEEQKAALKAARQEAKKKHEPQARRVDDEPPKPKTNGFKQPKGKQKAKVEEEVTEDKIAEAIRSVEEKRAKLVEKWMDVWDGECS